jgi:hypothetical protein
MEYLGAIVAMVKILAVVVLFILVIYSIAVENDPKRKLSEVVTCIAIVAIIAGMQTVLPKMLGTNNKDLATALTNWDPSMLLKSK